jgi:hypothetical protein
MKLRNKENMNPQGKRGACLGLRPRVKPDQFDVTPKQALVETDHGGGLCTNSIICRMSRGRLARIRNRTFVAVGPWRSLFFVALAGPACSPTG